MKLQFLGTGAADWTLNDYTPGKEFRHCSSALINDDLLIDPGPHIFHFTEMSGQPRLLDHVKNIIVTHTHYDHFNMETITRLCAGRDCTLWGDPACLRLMQKELPAETLAQITFRENTLYTPFSCGNYTVTPMRANHATDDPEETTRVYLVQEGERILYYGCDSGWIPTRTWYTLRETPVNAMVMECTCGETAPDDWRIFDHNTLDMLHLMLNMFRKYNYFAPDVKYYTSHMARTLHNDHASLKKFLAAWDVVPAFDGMTIDI